MSLVMLRAGRGVASVIQASILGAGNPRSGQGSSFPVSPPRSSGRRRSSRASSTSRVPCWRVHGLDRDHRPEPLGRAVLHRIDLLRWRSARRVDRCPLPDRCRLMRWSPSARTPACVDDPRLAVRPRLCHLRRCHAVIGQAGSTFSCGELGDPRGASPVDSGSSGSCRGPGARVLQEQSRVRGVDHALFPVVSSGSRSAIASIAGGRRGSLSTPARGSSSSTATLPRYADTLARKVSTRSRIGLDSVVSADLGVAELWEPTSSARCAATPSQSSGCRTPRARPANRRG